MPKIGPQRKNDQQVSDMVKEKSTPKNIFGYSPTTSSAQTRRQAKLKDTAAFTDGRKVSGKSFGMKMGSKQIDSPSTFSSKQAGTIAKAPAFKNTKKANRIANRAAKTRSKGESTLESGNLAKARRMRKRYDRQTKRLKKS